MNKIRYKNYKFLKKINRNFYSTPYKSSTALPKLTPQEVNNLLKSDEYTHEFSQGPVKSYDSNQLASNNPIEDMRAEAICLPNQGLLFGIFDGHAGRSCAQVISKRLFDYIAATLLPPSSLKRYLSEIETQNPPSLVEHFNDKTVIQDNLAKLYKKSFGKFIKFLAKSNLHESFDFKIAMETAFNHLDKDITDEAKNQNEHNLEDITLSVAMSGAVTCVAHINGSHLHICNVGDCSAILGIKSETDSWLPKKLTNEHCTENTKEVNRILNEHPLKEKETILRFGRLLGELAPLRAFGDVRYKWDVETLKRYVVNKYGSDIIPQNYFTPPYLSCTPEVIHHVLTPRDKFLVIASDGLWEFMSPLQVVRLVGEHMRGKVTLNPLILPKKELTLKEINKTLLQRKEGLKMKPKDKNVATHLIRNALGGTEYGVDHYKLTQLLCLPKEVVRLFRDDITVTVIYFDSDYLRHCPM